MDRLLSRPYCSSCIQARDRHFYFKKPDLGEAGGLFKTCLPCREKKKRKPLQELDPNILLPQRKKARPKTSRPKPQFTGQETRPETRPTHPTRQELPTDPPSTTLTSPENALPAPIRSGTRPELPESRPEAAPLQPQ
jgi:hypothetical protein